ncbi:unnamed protein product [Urochloa humidicola]
MSPRRRGGAPAILNTAPIARAQNAPGHTKSRPPWPEGGTAGELGLNHRRRHRADRSHHTYAIHTGRRCRRRHAPAAAATGAARVAHSRRRTTSAAAHSFNGRQGDPHRLHSPPPPPPTPSRTPPHGSPLPSPSRASPHEPPPPKAIRAPPRRLPPLPPSLTPPHLPPPAAGRPPPHIPPTDPRPHRVAFRSGRRRAGFEASCLRRRRRGRRRRRTPPGAGSRACRGHPEEGEELRAAAFPRVSRISADTLRQRRDG